MTEESRGREPLNYAWEVLEKLIASSKPIDSIGKSSDIPERVQANTVLEKWVQRYISQHPDQLGLSNLQGPFQTGPDFRGTYQDRNIWIEAEVWSKNYVRHGHHEDSRWNKVELLIVLESEDPGETIRQYLPREILHIDKAHFTPWYQEAIREHALRKAPQDAADHLRFQTTFRLDRIAERIHHNWLEACPHTERDMAMCPYCDSCAYFGEGIGDAPQVFGDLAIQFVQARGGVLNIGEIEVNEVDAYCAARFG